MSVFRRLISVFRTRQLDQDLQDELRSHIEMRAEDNVESGMAADQARLDALRRFGNELALREQTRSTHMLVWLETVLQDIRYALRILRKAPAFTMVAALSVALGVGINTAVFSLIDAMLFRQVKLADPTRLVSLYRVAATGETRSTFPMAVIAQLREQNHVFSGMAGWYGTTMGARVNGEPPESLHAGFYGGNYYSLLGVGTALGRTLTPEDDQPGATPAAMISYAYWQARFSGDQNVLNRTISAKGVVFKIVGVTPADFTGLMVLDKAPDIALPLAWYPHFKLNDDDVAANIVARLAPGATLQQAGTEMNLLFRRIPPESLGTDWAVEIKRGLLGQSIDVRPRGSGDEWRWNDYKLRLTLLMSVVGLVLVIACANVANLLMARATARRKEIAVRLAIGAPRWRVVRQLLTESLLLAGVGGALGLWLALFAHRALSRWLEIEGPFALDWRVLAFAACVCLMAGAFFGLLPAFRGTRLDLVSSVKECGAENSFSSAGSRFGAGKSLVALQVALSLVLVTGTGLLLETLNNLASVDPGFDRENVLLFWIYPTTGGYQGNNEIQLYGEYLRRFNAVPGVTQASMARHYLMQGASNFHRVTVHQANGKDAESQVALNAVAPGFFSTMRIPIVAGRDFSAKDSANSAKTAIVDQKFATSHFPGENPLGKHLILPANQGLLDLEIAGVVADLHYHGLRQGDDIPSQEVFLPFTQAPSEMLGQMCFAVRTRSNPSSFLNTLRHEAAAVEKNLPLVWPTTQAEVAEGSIQAEHSLTALIGLLTGLAVLLACIGLYGVMAYSVSRRTREIGVRMALGAPRAGIRWLVLRESLLLSGSGIAVGVPAALVATHLMKSILYGVAPSDPPTVVAASVLLVAVAVVAAYFPARRASHVDPMVALRNE
jgi:predicted permease